MSETNWNDLARRCEEATGADRKLDGDISKAATGEAGLTPYTGSLDAITALIERELPKAIIASGMNPKEHWGSEEPYGAWAALHPSEGDPPDDGYRADQCATEAAARCAAFCRAMAHRSTPHE